MKRAARTLSSDNVGSSLLEAGAPPPSSWLTMPSCCAIDSAYLVAVLLSGPTNGSRNSSGCTSGCTPPLRSQWSSALLSSDSAGPLVVPLEKRSSSAWSSEGSTAAAATAVRAAVLGPRDRRLLCGASLAALAAALDDDSAAATFGLHSPAHSSGANRCRCAYRRMTRSLDSS